MLHLYKLFNRSFLKLLFAHKSFCHFTIFLLSTKYYLSSLRQENTIHATELVL